MQLTENERAALERWRHGRYGGSPNAAELSRRVDADILAQSLTRLFPVRTYGDLVIRWDDAITPERLVACGFVRYDTETPRGYQVVRYKAGQLQFSDTMRLLVDGLPTRDAVQPRNMMEAWQLMERCGIEEGGK